MLSLLLRDWPDKWMAAAVGTVRCCCCICSPGCGCGGGGGGGSDTMTNLKPHIGFHPPQDEESNYFVVKVCRCENGGRHILANSMLFLQPS